MLGEPSLKVVTRIFQTAQRTDFRTCSAMLINSWIMPRTCTVCAHPALEQIDRSLVHGESLRSIAGRYDVSTSALHRHKQSDLPELLQRAYEDQEHVRAKGLVEEIEEQLAIGKDIQSRAMDNGDLRLGLSAIRETRGLLALLGKARGELPAQPEPTAPAKVFRIDTLPSLEALPPPPDSPLPEEMRGLKAGSVEQEEEIEGFGVRFTPAQQEAGNVRRKLLGPDKRAARKDWNRTH